MNENNKRNLETVEEKLWKIGGNIEDYREMIDNAEGAMAEAEREIRELLAETYEQENLSEWYPE